MSDPNKFDKGKDNNTGIIRRSIYSPGWHGERVPNGKPGKHRALISADYFGEGHRESWGSYGWWTAERIARAER